MRAAVVAVLLTVTGFVYLLQGDDQQALICFVGSLIIQEVDRG